MNIPHREEGELPAECLRARLALDEAFPGAGDPHLRDCVSCAAWASRVGLLEKGIRGLPPVGARDRALKVLARADSEGVEWAFSIPPQGGDDSEAGFFLGIGKRARGRSNAARKLSIAAGILAALMLVSVGMWLGKHQEKAYQQSLAKADPQTEFAGRVEDTLTQEKLIKEVAPLATMAALSSVALGYQEQVSELFSGKDRWDLQLNLRRLNEKDPTGKDHALPFLFPETMANNSPSSPVPPPASGASGKPAEFFGAAKPGTGGPSRTEPAMTPADGPVASQNSPPGAPPPVMARSIGPTPTAGQDGIMTPVSPKTLGGATRAKKGEAENGLALAKPEMDTKKKKNAADQGELRGTTPAQPPSDNKMGKFAKDPEAKNPGAVLAEDLGRGTGKERFLTQRDMAAKQGQALNLGEQERIGTYFFGVQGLNRNLGLNTNIPEMVARFAVQVEDARQKNEMARGFVAPGNANPRFLEVEAKLELVAKNLNDMAPKMLAAALQLPEKDRKEALTKLAKEWEKQESVFQKLAVSHMEHKEALGNLVAITKKAREDAIREAAKIA